MSEEYHLEDDIRFFRNLILASPSGAATLEEISGGFTEHRARQILDDPELLRLLRLLATRVEPGPGWTTQALSGQAPDSAELYFVALEERPGETAEAIGIRRDAGSTLLTPERLDQLDPDALARVELPGGWAAWHPADLAGAPAIGFGGTEVPGWLPVLLDPRVLDDVAAGHARTSAETILSGPHPLSRYALGQWLRHHSMPALPDSVLRVELGALAWEHADLLGRTGPARELLAGAGPLVLELSGQAAMWPAPRRALAQADLSRAAAAVVSLYPSVPEAAALAQLAAGEAHPSPIGAGAMPLDAFALAASGVGPVVPAEVKSLVRPVNRARMRAIEDLDSEVPGAGEDPERPFVAELIVHG